MFFWQVGAGFCSRQDTVSGTAERGASLKWKVLCSTSTVKNITVLHQVPISTPPSQHEYEYQSTLTVTVLHSHEYEYVCERSEDKSDIPSNDIRVL